MTDLVHHRESTRAIALPLPPPRSGPIVIRPAALPPEGGADVMFIDQLQKKHSKMVGFMPLNQLEKRITSGRVLIAQDPDTTERVGYCIFADKYFKREDLGIIYHLNIIPGRQRGLVGAALVRGSFDRCPWGVKLFCCWCAQDLEANYFWEALGFVPIAFRAGSRGKTHGGTRKDGRMQIFWQQRIREGDTQTPYWYPTETSGGLMRENRIVLPMPPGTSWNDELPYVLPGAGAEEKSEIRGQIREQRSEDRDQRSEIRGQRPRKRKPKAKAKTVPPKPRQGLWFATPAVPAPASIEPKPPKPKREKQKNDPKFIAAARELRDRYLEQVNTGQLLPGADAAKYDVSRALAAAPLPGVATHLPTRNLLDAA